MMRAGPWRHLVITVLYVFFLAVALLYPFTFAKPWRFEKTDVRRLPGAGGIGLSSTSALLTEAPPRGMYDSLVSGSGVSIEVALSPAGRRHESVVLSYSSGWGIPNFEVMQEGGSLVFFLKTDATSTDEWGWKLAVDDVMEPGRLTHVVLTYDLSTQRAFVDGKEAASSGRIRGGFTGWSPSHLLFLGNAPRGNLPWRGRIYKLAIYNRPLTRSEVLGNYRAGKSFPPGSRAEEAGVTEGLVALYLFNGPEGDTVRDLSGTEPKTDLHIPETIKVTVKEFLEPPFRGFSLKLNTLMDMAVNIALFAPLGFLSLSLLRGRGFSTAFSCLAVLVAGAALSLGMEALQFFLPGRFSSLTDLVNNCIGIALGILTGYVHVNAGTRGMTGKQG